MAKAVEVKMVNVQALKAKKDKPQHMVPGMVYEVTEDIAELLVKNGTAVVTDKKAGKVYQLGKETQKAPPPVKIED